MAPSHQSTVAPARLVVPLAVAVGVAFGAVLYGFSVLITARAAGAEFSSTVLSTAFGGAVLASGVVAIPVGRAVDRSGVRGVLALGSTLVGLGFAGFAAAREPWQVLATWWLLVGPGTAMVLFDPAFIALEQWFDRADRNRAAGTLTLVTGLAGPIFVPATSRLVEVAGWRPAALSLGALMAVVGWLVAGPALAVAPARARGHSARRLDLRPTMASRRFVLLCLAMALLFAALEAMQVHRVARFEEAGFAAGTVAWWAAVASLASLPGRFVAPRLATRLEGWATMLVLVVLLVPAYALAIRGTTTWEMTSHFLLFGVLFGATIPLRVVVMGDWFGGSGFGTLMGVQAVAIAAGRAAGPAAVGWLRDLTGGYRASMLLLMALAAAVAMLLWGCRRLGGPSG